jgi:hypothetical protein
MLTPSKVCMFPKVMASMSSGVSLVLRKAASTASLIISGMFTSLRLLTKTGVYPTPIIPTFRIYHPSSVLRTMTPLCCAQKPSWLCARAVFAPDTCASPASPFN